MCRESKEGCSAFATYDYFKTLKAKGPQCDRINPPTFLQHRYMLTTTDCFTWWSESIPLAIVNNTMMIHLIEQQIITRFGVPSIFKFDSGLYSRSMDIVDFSLDKEINLRYSSNYYPRGNGVAESMNKNLLGIIGKKCIIKA